MTGYYLSGTDCVKCAFPCSACGTDGKCTSCIPGYEFESNSCKLCSTPCATCSGT